MEEQRCESGACGYAVATVGGTADRPPKASWIGEGGSVGQKRRSRQTDVRVLLVGRSAGGRPVPCVGELQGGQALAGAEAMTLMTMMTELWACAMCSREEATQHLSPTSK